MATLTEVFFNQMHLNRCQKKTLPFLGKKDQQVSLELIPGDVFYWPKIRNWAWFNPSLLFIRNDCSRCVVVETSDVAAAHVLPVCQEHSSPRMNWIFHQTFQKAQLKIKPTVLLYLCFTIIWFSCQIQLSFKAWAKGAKIRLRPTTGKWMEFASSCNKPQQKELYNNKKKSYG